MDRVTLGLEIEVAKAQLRLKGEALLPIERERLRFEMDLKGENFASFDELLGTSLPPLGPYSLGGGFEIRPNGYSVDGLRVRLGDSNLTGSLAVDTTGPRPNLTVDLVTQTFQLDDFDTGDWSPMDDEGEAVAEADEAQADLDAAAAARDVQALLSPEVMQSLDASLKLEVEQVLSGADELGHGALLASLVDGKFTVDPLTVNVPGGSVDIGFDYEPTEAGVKAGARAQVDRLDYGLLARRIDPASDVGGLISVEAELRSESESLDEIMNGANGHIDFAILPEDLDAGIFDLWAVNLLMAALPALDEESQSRVNCIVARFKIEDGIMTPEALLVDSTRIQASGDGTIDFKEDTIEFVLAPRAKSPQMFSASTPIKVEGSIADFEVGVGTGDILGTVFRMTTSVVTTPFKWVFSKRVAPDGEAACAEAWARDVPQDAEAGED